MMMMMMMISLPHLLPFLQHFNKPSGHLSPATTRRKQYPQLFCSVQCFSDSLRVTDEETSMMMRVNRPYEVVL